jgi:hypothetical protein
MLRAATRCFRAAASCVYTQDFGPILEHPAVKARGTSLSTSSILDVTFLSPLRHLTALQLGGFLPSKESMLVMQQLTCLTHLSVEFLFNPPPNQQDVRCCTLPPHLKLLCVYHLRLYEIESWLPALMKVSWWVGWVKYRNHATWEADMSEDTRPCVQLDHRITIVKRCQ